MIRAPVSTTSVKILIAISVALLTELPLLVPLCYSDSTVAPLYWIQGYNQERKQFVENRANSIWEAFPPQY